MRIPHHLTCSPTGLWAFRQRVPTDLQGLVGRRVFKRTLRTRDLPTARLRALALAAGYAQAFDVLRDQRVDKLSKREADELIARLTQSDNLKELILHRSRAADGTVTERWQIDNEEDLRLFQKMQRQGADPLLDAVNGAPSPAPAPVPKSKLTPITLEDACDAWLATLKGNTLPKTWTIKRTAIVSLVGFRGSKTKLHTLMRTDLARWYQHMREEGASTPTLTNKQSYIGGKGGFFEWAMASGYYPRGDNVAAGHVSYSIREKRARRKFGFKPYDTHQVQALFAPAAFERLALSARWAAVIGLYTGARAAEVGQLLPSDVTEQAGLLCIHMSDEGEHQKLKSDASIRTVPVTLICWPSGLRNGLRDYGRQMQNGCSRPPNRMPRTAPAIGSLRRSAATWKPWARTGRPASAASIRSGKPSFSRFKERAYRPSSEPRWWDTSWTTSTTRRIAAN